MLIESVEKSITYRWPGGEVRLDPGVPVDLPTDRARRLLARAAGRVWVYDSLAVGTVIEWDSPLKYLRGSFLVSISCGSACAQLRARDRPKKDVNLLACHAMKRASTIPTLMTQKQFAKYLRVAPSQISRWKDQDRLVMVDTRPRPMVDVKQSLDLLVATADPSDYFFRDTPVPWWLAEAWDEADRS